MSGDRVRTSAQVSRERERVKGRVRGPWVSRGQVSDHDSSIVLRATGLCVFFDRKTSSLTSKVL